MLDEANILLKIRESDSDIDLKDDIPRLTKEKLELKI